MRTPDPQWPDGIDAAEVADIASAVGLMLPPDIAEHIASQVAAAADESRTDSHEPPVT
ncbi:hypothetical protein [Frankia sp. CcI49]|uniref:hypothetical protein n=1 Tax=Frankia sp. CcI49 TaxID=1745382 RepID=UPI001304041B|nr:hypothetical protein [Frankia sp. CcI49]